MYDRVLTGRSGPRADRNFFCSENDTRSLTSSITRHHEEWNRTYHQFGRDQNKYWCPNDDQQNDALDIHHHLLTLLLDGELFLAPIDGPNVREVLDLGCGTGIWSIDFADAHPDAQVTGIDLSPIQPHWTHPNCHFVVDDVEDRWTENVFDFVHIRCLMGSVKDWPKLYRQAYQHTAPGGWIQHLDMSFMFASDDESVSDGHIMRQWSEELIDAGKRLGKTFQIIDTASNLIRGAGYEDVVEKRFKVPVGSWPRKKVVSARMTAQLELTFAIASQGNWLLELPLLPSER